MKNLFSPKIVRLAEILNKPLFAVGGVVRDYIIDNSFSEDIDLASPLSVGELTSFARECDIEVVGEYKRTGTAILYDGKIKYEFTSFRQDIYGEGGLHTPEITLPTDSIVEDALRRDFKCNAVYYDIKNGEFCDPLGGISDIDSKVLSTVKEASEVFSHDGLRLMRLARLSGELNFKPSEETLRGARENCHKIKDISVERIFAELGRILSSDKKHDFSDKEGHYNGLKILEEIGVLEIILPEVYLGKGLAQRSDYHKYDVLEHTLRTVLYAEEEIRLPALLHDVGKPFCFKRDGNFYFHAKEGEKISEQVLKRFKSSSSLIKKTCYLVRNHMLQTEEMKEKKLRRFIADNFDEIDALIKIKEADYRALKDKEIPKSFLIRLKKTREKMLMDGTPIKLKELKVGAKELKALGVEDREIGKTLKQLRELCIEDPALNNEEKLLKIVQNRGKTLKK